MRIDYKGDLDKLFFTSDSHWLHDNIRAFCNRPFSSNEEQTEELIRRWNEVVPEDGIVFHGGDLCWTGNVELIDRLVSRLNGSIHLVLGNHDLKNKLDRRGIAEMFEKKGGSVSDMLTTIVRKDNDQQILSCHYPLLFWPPRMIMAHGHIHSGPNSISSEVAPFHPLRYDVGVDNNNFYPISYIKLMEIIERQKMQEIYRQYGIGGQDT